MNRNVGCAWSLTDSSRENYWQHILSLPLAIINIWLGYFYRHNRNKTVTGLHHVPNDRPVILACNHPNAFMDAIMLGSTTRRRTWFLARSDVFRKKWLAQFLSFIGIIPIYRLLEGAENLSKNDETFEKCAKSVPRK